MLGNLLRPEIAELIAQRNFTALRDALSELPGAEIAEALEELPAEDAAVVFRVLSRSLAADAFSLLPTDYQEQLLRRLGEAQTATILSDMPPDDRTHLLEELPAEATKRLLSLLPATELAVAQKLLGYPESSVGRMMTPQYVAVRQEWTCGEALEQVRRSHLRSENLGFVYVVDNRGRLVDDLRLGDVVVAPEEAPVESLMDENFRALQAIEDQESAVATFRKDRREALPVVDSQGVLIGVVTADDVLAVAETEATEDIQKLGGTEALEEPYLKIALPLMVKKRAGWLVILFLGEMLTATAMAYFQDELGKALVLSLFIPLIISSGGNSGSQAATLVIRAMALGEVGLRDWWRVMKREIASGLALGGILGLIGFLRVTIWSQFSNLYGPHWLGVGIVVGISLIGVVLWGTLSGSMLPLLLKKCRLDPAVSSAPFVATMVDVTGLVIYFTCASMILGRKLL